jgi:hypothetical protein
MMDGNQIGQTLRRKSGLFVMTQKLIITAYTIQQTKKVVMFILKAKGYVKLRLK